MQALDTGLQVQKSLGQTRQLLAELLCEQGRMDFQMEADVRMILTKQFEQFQSPSVII